MKKTPLIAALGALILLFFGCNQEKKVSDRPFDWESGVGAQLSPNAPEDFWVGDYGATGDGVFLNTEAIQKAIDDCSAQGGGTVRFLPGIYLTGSVYVKSHVNLHIGEGVLLRASQDIADYPRIDTRVAGVEMVWPSAIINVIGQENVAVTGKGIIEGRGKPFWDLYWATRKEYEERGLRWIVDYDVERPRGVLVQDCKHVTLTDFTLFQAGFWSVHILYSQHVTADGLIIVNNIEGHGPSTDGIDIDSSSDILVQNCDISCNDDNFCLKSGRDYDGLRVNRPTERVVIRDCIARTGGGLITCGSETSGGIRDIVAYNLKAYGTQAGLRFKSAFTRGGTVERIYFSEIEMVGVQNPLVVELNWNPSYSYSRLPEGYDAEKLPHHWKMMLAEVDPEKGMPVFRDIRFTNITATGARTAIKVGGVEKSPARSFHLTNVNIDAKNPGTVQYALDWTIDNVTIRGEDGAPVDIKNSPGLIL